MDEFPTHVPGAAGTEQRRQITAWLLTCPQRLPLLQRTLASFRNTDWQSPLRIHCTPPSGEPGAPDENPIDRGHAAILRSALEGPGTHFLILEDDVIFNVHLQWNLTHWALWEHADEIHFATLYNPGIPRATPVHPSALTFSPSANVGAQARLLSRECAAHVAENLSVAGQGQNWQTAELAAELGPLWVHCPSLVQHSGGESTWGGAEHQAVDFDPSWRSP